MHYDNKFTVELVSFTETKLAVYQHRAAANLLPKSIERFIRWRKENHLPPSKCKTFNLIYDNPNTTPNDCYRFDIGCEVTEPVLENKQGVVNKIIPASQCAKVRLKGCDEQLPAALHFLYDHWINQSSFTLKDTPVIIERVVFGPTLTHDDTITDIYLPIQAV